MVCEPSVFSFRIFLGGVRVWGWGLQGVPQRRGQVVPDSGFRAERFGSQFSGFGVRVSGIAFRFSIFGFRFSVFVFAVSGFGLRCFLVVEFRV